MPRRGKEAAAYNFLKEQSRRLTWLFENGPCAKCGSWIDLEVDHVNPSERGVKRTSYIWRWSKENRAVELAKCQPLCQKCHQEKTASEHKRAVTHGTLSGYQHYGCRCEDCRAAARNYNHVCKIRKTLRLLCSTTDHSKRSDKAAGLISGAAITKHQSIILGV